MSEEFKDFSIYEEYLLSIEPELYELLDCGWEIDRIDNNKGYERGNLKLSTYREQANNRRNNHIVEICGERLTLSQASSRYAVVGAPIIGRRIKNGFNVQEAVFLPKLPHFNVPYKNWKKAKFPNDITLEEALAPVLIPILGIELRSLATRKLRKEC